MTSIVSWEPDEHGFCRAPLGELLQFTIWERTCFDVAPPLSGSKEQSNSSQSLIPPGVDFHLSRDGALFPLGSPEQPKRRSHPPVHGVLCNIAVPGRIGAVRLLLGVFHSGDSSRPFDAEVRINLVLSSGCLLFSTGAFLFWPAALAGSYSFFLTALFVIASGLSFLETASNPFIAQLGDPGSAARRLNFSQAFNPLGSIAGVLVGTVFIFSGIEHSPAQISAMRAAHTLAAYQRHQTMRIVTPYLVIGAITLLWAILVARTKFPTIARETEGADHDNGSFRQLLRYPDFLFAIVAQFAYVGAQVGTWSYFIQYVQDTTHQPEKIAGYFLTGTLIVFGIGRFASAALMRYNAQFYGTV